MARTEDRAVGVWLMVVAAFVAVMILVGGATRLTDSGLSITEWNFAKQVVPPLTERGWQVEFDLYRQTTEYQVQNRGMSLAEFQFIYWWEWGHRFLGKVIGVVYALPFFVFLALGRLKGRVAPLTALFALGGLQGYIGWWMVESGLTGRLDVAPYRLATHLGMAFLIFALALRLGLKELGWPRAAGAAGVPRWAVFAFSGLLFFQILAGALVAGSDAGRAYADWPTIGGEVFPSTYWAMSPAAANLFENHAAVQFNHRTLGYLVVAFALVLGWRAWRAGAGAARGAGLAIAGLALFQTALGVVTVLHAAPLSLSLLHQGGAVALWAATVALIAATARYPNTAAETPRAARPEPAPLDTPAASA